MNIESATITKTNQINETSASAKGTATAKEEKSFKEELEATKSQDKTQNVNDLKNIETAENETGTLKQDDLTPKVSQENLANNVSQQVNKNQLAKEKDKDTENNFKKLNISDPLNELNSQIAALNELNPKIKNIDAKTENKTSDKDDYCQRIKMDNNDITFFVNLVQNQQMTAHNVQVSDKQSIDFTDIKTEAAQQTVQVSKTLLDALNESVKTNKPFRIDFDNNIAVVMKVDKEGNISANFIPGNAAVENYLRNNIANLRQNFDNQNLPYNELSYSRQQKQNQEQRNQNKENENE